MSDVICWLHKEPSPKLTLTSMKFWFATGIYIICKIWDYSIAYILWSIYCWPSLTHYLTASVLPLNNKAHLVLFYWGFNRKKTNHCLIKHCLTSVNMCIGWESKIWLEGTEHFFNMGIQWITERCISVQWIAQHMKNAMQWHSHSWAVHCTYRQLFIRMPNSAKIIEWISCYSRKHKRTKAQEKN